jgi:hypothetical protein
MAILHEMRERRVLVRFVDAGTEQVVDLGRVPDAISLAELKEMVMGRMVGQLPEELREASRHFWYNDEVIAYKGQITRLRDVSAASTVSLELRTDYYQVRIGNQTAPYAVDMELPIREVIDRCLRRPGAHKCHELVAEGKVLDPEKNLFRYNILPFQRGVRETVLIIRLRGCVRRTMAAAGAGVLLLSFIIGYLT